MIDNLQICSPKRNAKQPVGWEGFFPYYAGYPEHFARNIIESAGLPPDARILDPWNGSGTTTYAAAQAGFNAYGFDINPVMVIVSRARLLSSSEADSLGPLARVVTERANKIDIEDIGNDPLLSWFCAETTRSIRAIEMSIRVNLMGNLSFTAEGVKIDKISSIAAAFFVALFTVCRELAGPFRSTNPTWFKLPKDGEPRIRCLGPDVADLFATKIKSMEEALSKQNAFSAICAQNTWSVGVADATLGNIFESYFDLVLTSPPYCTRIDYAAATRVELAIISPIVSDCTKDLARRMIGSTKVPTRQIEPSTRWGQACLELLSAIKAHPSKASSTYYYKTHLDYFDKMHFSLAGISASLKTRGVAVMVVQDSYYKQIHNDLPQIVGQICENVGLQLVRREDFRAGKSMSRINPRTRAYGRRPEAIESVMCFRKI